MAQALLPEVLRARLRALAADLDRIDVDVYAQAGRDPHDPTLGTGDRRARIAFFGRDPGRHEVLHDAPFIGAGGQKVRAVLHQRLHGAPLPDFEASVAVGAHAFWANTVPYKPLGNKVWSARTRKAFRPVVADWLLGSWDGHDVLVLGKVPFDWFADDRETRARAKAFWARDDRYEAAFEVDLHAPNAGSRRLRLHPLPHPSPLNATWAPRFPGLLDQALERLGWGPETWRA